MTDRRHLARAAFLAAAMLLSLPALAAQSAGQAQQPVQGYPGPHISGTVTFWNGYRIDLKTPDGKTVQVAVNPKTERLVDIKKDEKVTVDYRRKIDDFVIALRVRPPEAASAAAGMAPESVTGTVVSRPARPWSCGPARATSPCSCRHRPRSRSNLSLQAAW